MVHGTKLTYLGSSKPIASLSNQCINNQPLLPPPSLLMPQVLLNGVQMACLPLLKKNSLTLDLSVIPRSPKRRNLLSQQLLSLPLRNLRPNTRVNLVPSLTCLPMESPTVFKWDSSMNSTLSTVVRATTDSYSVSSRLLLNFGKTKTKPTANLTRRQRKFSKSTTKKTQTLILELVQVSVLPRSLARRVVKQPIKQLLPKRRLMLKPRLLRLQLCNPMRRK